MILISDDVVAEMTARIIEEDTPYLCLPYANANKCLDDIEQGLQFDLFFTDLAVDFTDLAIESLRRGITGEDLGSRVKTLHPRVPIITISAYDFDPSFSQYHLVKPVRPSKYITVLRSFLD